MPSEGIEIPSGIIVMWSGAIANIPQGWFLCNGSNGTPDLTDRFIIHADADSGGTNDVGDTGGANSVTLTTAQIPSHSHNISSINTTNASGTGFLHRSQTPANQTNTTDAAGGGGSHENRPSYYALAFIMKS